MFLFISYLYSNIAIKETMLLIFLFFAIVTGLILSCSKFFNMAFIFVVEKQYSYFKQFIAFLTFLCNVAVSNSNMQFSFCLRLL